MPGEWYADPSGVYDHRWWDGDRWTEHVSLAGAQLVDHVNDPSLLSTSIPADPSPQQPAPGDGGTSQAGGSHAGAPVGRARRGATADRTVGDRVVNALGTVTLNNWMNRRMADLFLVPQVADAVRERPRDPIRRLHLGVRLAELRLANDRIRKAMPHMSGASIVTRPVTRAVGRAVTNSLRSDTTPAHAKVLSPLHGHLVEHVRRQPRDPEALNALARIYWVADDPGRAMELVKISSKADPGRGETYYIGAELLIDLGQFDYVLPWARHAWELGCGLAGAVLHPQAVHRRQAYRSPSLSTLTGYSTERHLRAMASYYQARAVRRAGRLPRAEPRDRQTPGAPVPPWMTSTSTSTLTSTSTWTWTSMAWPTSSWTTGSRTPRPSSSTSTIR